MPGRTFIFFPEGAYGPTNNCVGIGDVLRRRGHRVVFIAEESFAGTLEAKGFEERLMRLTPPDENAEEDPGQFWKDFIRETAPVFRRPTIEQLAGFIGPTFEALLRRRPVRGRAPGRDHRRGRAGRDRRGQRRLLPRAAGRRPPVGADRLLQPGRGQGPGGPADVLRLSGRRARRVGGLPRGVRARPRPAAVVVQRLLRRARRAAAARARVHPHLPRPEPVALPERGRLRPLAPARRRLAQPRVVRARHRRRLGAARAAGVGVGPARVPQPRLARVGRRRADAQPDRRAWPTPPTG